MLKRIVYVLLLISITVVLTGCFNKEKKANEIIDYFDDVKMIEDSTKEDLGDYSLDVRKKTRDNDVEGMINVTEDVIKVIEEHKKEIQQIELEYKPTKKLQSLHIEVMDESLSYFKWQVDVLKYESPEEEFEEIMKEEEGLFGEETDYNDDSDYIKKAEEIDKKNEAFKEEIDYYWDLYNIEDYMD